MDGVACVAVPIAFTVTELKNFPEDGVTVCADVEDVTVLVSVGTAATVTAPVVYTPPGTAVCADVLGVTVFAACVESCLVFLVPLAK
jgi:hypothetical protein